MEKIQKIKNNIKSKKKSLSIQIYFIDKLEPILELLAQCVHLEKLDMRIHDRCLTDCTFLKNLTNLKYLDISGQRRSSSSDKPVDISPLKNLIHLEYLDFRIYGAVGYNSLQYCKNLVELDLSGTKLQDLSFLKELHHLKVLKLGKNKIVDIQPLSNLVKMEVLWLYDNNIINLTPLKKLIQLNELEISNNSITDITALENLTKLTSLDLTNNSIAEISALKNCKTLKYLYIQGNKVVDISALSQCKALRELYLGENKIKEIKPITQLGKVHLSLNRNPVKDCPLLYYKDNNLGLIKRYFNGKLKDPIYNQEFEDIIKKTKREGYKNIKNFKPAPKVYQNEIAHWEDAKQINLVIYFATKVGNESEIYSYPDLKDLKDSGSYGNGDLESMIMRNYVFYLLKTNIKLEEAQFKTLYTVFLKYTHFKAAYETFFGITKCWPITALLDKTIKQYKKSPPKNIELLLLKLKKVLIEEIEESNFPSSLISCAQKINKALGTEENLKEKYALEKSMSDLDKINTNNVKDLFQLVKENFNFDFSKNITNAEDDLKEILKADKSNIEAWFCLGVLNSQYEDTYECQAEAINCFSEVLQIEPNHHFAWAALSDLYDDISEGRPFQVYEDIKPAFVPKEVKALFEKLENLDYNDDSDYVSITTNAFLAASKRFREKAEELKAKKL